jgi:DMSO/TMAO reductase YedYZ molybdopterin-dependent catalytic subunit
MATSVEVPTRVGSPEPAPVGRATTAGVVAVAVALGVAELAGGLVPAVARPVLTVGDRVVDLAPPALKDFAVEAFGTADKPVLLAGVVVVCIALGAALGLLGRRRFWFAASGFGAFASLGVAAAAQDPDSNLLATAAALAVAVSAGLFTLHRLLRAATARVGGAASTERAPDDPPAFDRRRFFRLAVGAGAVAGVAAIGGQVAGRSAVTEAARSAVSLPAALRPLPAAAAGTSFEIEGLSPLFVPNDEFYRIDTALSIPQVDPDGWFLHVTGMVDRPFSLSYEDLLAEPLEEGDITLACVSNNVGGGLVGNARWLGVPLAGLLERAGVRPAATQLVGRSVDGFTVGFPTEAALDGRQALVAIGMNSEPLPAKHGFPARLVVPGLFGYVSATKWLTEIELTTWEAFDAYWVPRGWDKRAPVITQSRIDVPFTGRTVPAGTVQVAGVAWQPEHGIDFVEVAVDGGWRPAELADDLARSAWRQWRYAWQAQPGDHELTVRATDGSGALQTSVEMGPRPFGATGYHTIRVRVEA